MKVLIKSDKLLTPETESIPGIIFYLCLTISYMTKKVVHMVNDVLPWRKMVKNVWEIGGPEPDVCTIPMYLNYECLSALQKKEKLFLFSNQISRGKKLMLLYDACFHAFLILTELSWRVNFIA